mmetsp:Transcript_12768/g.23947  ORF Transcript_12768/g.23947 Transcript_12768/m.23947 type:complete len:334 (-) Transcript_12768:71-1072(-)
MKFHKLSALFTLTISIGNAFVLPSSRTSVGGCIQNTYSCTPSQSLHKSTLSMSQEGKKKRRRRKQPQELTDNTDIQSEDSNLDDEEIETNSNVPSIDELKAIANFTPSKTKTSSNMSTEQIPSSSKTVPVDDGFADSFDTNSQIVELPDIRDALKNKELKKLEQEKEEVRSRPKISRKDRKALLQLLEEQPYADADDSYFEEEEYGTVSALLAEGAKPFLGIPPGPLQVGHFIGALGIILCAFIEYPGFPLTNLPTPLRDSLQGGLFTIYLINAVLAVLATFKAKERGQPAGLWAAKTFSVGGLALDQLTQLPTLKEVEETKNRKGARAAKKR